MIKFWKTPEKGLYGGCFADNHEWGEREEIGDRGWVVALQCSKCGRVDIRQTTASYEEFQERINETDRTDRPQTER